jgi:hypothetical protein
VTPPRPPRRLRRSPPPPPPQKPALIVHHVHDQIDPALIRREWVAAIRYAATAVLNPSERAAVQDRARRVEAGELSPWTTTTERTDHA